MTTFPLLIDDFSAPGLYEVLSGPDIYDDLSAPGLYDKGLHSVPDCQGSHWLLHPVQDHLGMTVRRLSNNLRGGGQLL